MTADRGKLDGEARHVAAKGGPITHVAALLGLGPNVASRLLIALLALCTDPTAVLPTMAVK